MATAVCEPEAIDLETANNLRPVPQVSLSRIGRKVSPASISRWIHQGCRGVRLSGVFVNGCWHTTPEAFDAFIRRQTDVMLRGVGG